MSIYQESFYTWARGQRRGPRKTTSRAIEYVRDYARERYRADPEYRERIREHNDRYAGRIKERNARIKVPKGSLLECSYCGEA